MSSKPEIIDISSDSTSTSSVEVMSPPPWAMVDASKSNSTDSNSISSYVSSYHSTSSEEYQSVSKKGTTDRACKKVSKCVNPPVQSKHVANQSLSINGKRIQVLGLPNKDTIAAIKEKRFGIKPFTTNATKAKGKRTMG